MKKVSFFIASFISFFSIGETLKITNGIALTTTAAIILHSPKTNAETVSSIITRGIMAAKSGNYYQAIKIYNKALEIDPNIALAYLSRGVSKMKLEDYSGAMTDFNKAIEINPRYAQAYLNRANLKVIMDEYSKAIEDYKKALEINPKLGEAYTGLGIAKIMSGFSNSIACLDFEKAIALGDNAKDLLKKYCSDIKKDGGYFYMRGNRKQNEGDYKGALKDFNKAIEIFPTYTVAYYSRAHLKEILKDYKGAIADLSKIIESTEEGSERAYLRRGVIKLKMKKNKEAIEDFNKSLEKKPNYIYPFLYRGIALLNIGEKEKACSDFKEIIFTYESKQYLLSMDDGLLDQANNISQEYCK